ncbi:MAG: phenylalanine--tRNA ligase subunit alpha [Candidatus Peregrinibacteria bacterium]
MLNIIANLKNSALSAIASAPSEDALRNAEVEYLGRKGSLTLLLREVPTLPLEERPIAGKTANEAKKEIEAALADRLFALEEARMGNLKDSEWIDITAPAKPLFKHGKRHPIHAFIAECETVFGRLGFSVAQGYEIEDDFHNFEALNFPPDHPAREMQDTFFLRGELEKMVLRTQTSDMQIRHMENNTPPIRVIAPGKVYRKDADATHSPMFHQIECLMIDKNVSLANLRFILLSALKDLISHDIDLRFRLSFFPFTEPSLEVDALLNVEGEKRWLEIGGAGMVHPNVLRNVHINPEQWNGFAFGFGIERMVMIKHGIKDLRLFFENDLRFLEQF